MIEVEKQLPIKSNTRSRTNLSIGFSDISRNQTLQGRMRDFGRTLSTFQGLSDSLNKAYLKDTTSLTPIGPDQNGYDFTQIPLPKPSRNLKPRLLAKPLQKLKNQRKANDIQSPQNPFQLRSYLSPVANSHHDSFSKGLRDKKGANFILKTENDDYSKSPGLSHSHSSKSMIPLNSSGLTQTRSIDKFQKLKVNRPSPTLKGSKQLSPLNKAKANSNMKIKTEGDQDLEPLIIRNVNEKINVALRYKLETNLLSPLETPKKETRITNAVKSPKNKQLRAITERTTILVLFDESLEFIKDYLSGFHFSTKFVYKKIEQYEYVLQKKEQSETCPDSLKKPNRLPHFAIFFFLKFSPRINQTRFAVIQELLKENTCYIVKCNTFGNFADLDLDYEDKEITHERKQSIEHQLNLTVNQFGVYGIEYENFNRLGSFLTQKLSLFIKKFK